MSLNTYALLKTAVENWTSDRSHTTLVVDFFSLGEIKTYREMRIRAMEVTLNVTLVAGVAAIPADYVELKSAAIAGNPDVPLSKKTSEYLLGRYSNRSSGSKPTMLAEEGLNFIFGPFPDSTYILKGMYYQRLTPLSDSNQTNWFTDNAPDILLWAALAEFYEFVDNDRKRDFFILKYEQAKLGINKEEIRQKRSGSTQSSRPG